MRHREDRLGVVVQRDADPDHRVAAVLTDDAAGRGQEVGFARGAHQRLAAVTERVERAVERTQPLVPAAALGDVVAADDDAADGVRRGAPGADLPAQPLAAAVGAVEGILVGPDNLAGQAAPMNLPPAFRDLREDVVVATTRQLLARQPEVRQPALADGHVAHLVVEHGDGCRRMVDEETELLLADAQLGADALGRLAGRGSVLEEVERGHTGTAQVLLRLLAPGDVEHDAVGADRFAAAIEIDLPARLEPAHRRRGRQHAELSGILAATFHALPQGGFDRGHVVGVDAVGPRPVAGLYGADLVAQQAVVLVVPDHRVAGEVPVPGRHGAGLQRQPQPLGARTQCLYRGLAFADVLNVRDHVEWPPVGIPDHRRTQVSPDGLAVLAQVPTLEAQSGLHPVEQLQRPRTDRALVIGVGEIEETTPEERRFAVPQHLAEGRIGPEDLAIWPGQCHGYGTAIEGDPEAFLARPHGVLGLPAFELAGRAHRHQCQNRFRQPTVCQRPTADDGDQADGRALRTPERRTEVTLSLQVLQHRIAGEQRPYVAREAADPLAHHGAARGVSQPVRYVVLELAVVVDGQCLCGQTAFRQPVDADEVHVERLGQVARQLPEEALALTADAAAPQEAEDILGAPTLGHVGDQGNDVGRLVAVVAQERDMLVDPDAAAIPVQVAVLGLERGDVAGQQLPDLVQVLLAVVRVDQGRECHLGEFGLAVARQAAVRRVALHEPPGAVGDGDPRGRVIEDLAEARLGAAQRGGQRDPPQPRFAYRGDGRHQHVDAAEVERGPPGPAQHPPDDRMEHDTEQSGRHQQQGSPIPAHKRRGQDTMAAPEHDRRESEHGDGRAEDELPDRRAALALDEEHRQPPFERQHHDQPYQT